MKKLFIMLFVSALFYSCATNRQIVRWPNNSEELQSRSLDRSVKESIFEDFLWTTPPVSSRKIENQFEFNGRTYDFEVRDKRLLIRGNGESYTIYPDKSENNIYPNTEYLLATWKAVPQWVPRTRTVPKTVHVRKTRTVPVTNIKPDGTPSTSYRTEHYTDFETRFVTKTEWVWETKLVPAYRIPSFDFYTVHIDGGKLFYIYNLKGEYYLQNPSYLMCTEYNESFWGEKEVNILFIDTNANGVYLEPDDHILFNTWNPYNPNHSYKEISHLMDNQWYYTDVLKESLYMEFGLSQETVDISYINEEYIGNENEGSLTVYGIEEYKPNILVNGKRYRIKEGTPFRSEYGNFIIQISVDNRLDYIESYTVNEENPAKIINYELTEEATQLTIENIFTNNYFVIIKNDRYEKTYYNVKEINIPRGKNRVDISVNGFTITKIIDTSGADAFSIDYEKEIEDL